jgi:hypothetical protein
MRGLEVAFQSVAVFKRFVANVASFRRSALLLQTDPFQSVSAPENKILSTGEKGAAGE